MPTSSLRAIAKSSTGAAKVVAKSRQGCRSIFAVMQLARARFGKKAPLELALRTDSDPRSGERWLAGKSMLAENLAGLIRSDIGDDVLEAIMGPDAKTWPEWYRAHRRQSKLSSLRQGLEAQKRALEALEREGA